MFFSIVIKLFKSRRWRQALSLYMSLILGLVVSIAVSSINTHALGVDDFGDYKFLQTASTLIITLITLGFFSSAGRLLAVAADDRSAREIIGGVLIIFLIIYSIFALCLYAFSYYLYEFFGRDDGWLVRLTLPLVFIYPLIVLFENALKGLNRVYSLAVMRVVPNILYLVYAYHISNAGLLDLKFAYVGYLSFSAIVLLFILLFLKPSFKNVFQNLITITVDTKTYGFKVYTGILASVATMHLGGVMVAYYLDTKSAGFFLLARTMTLPLTQISTIIGITFFKKFSTSQAIDSNVFLGVGITATLMLGGFSLLIDDVVVFLYPPEFLGIIPLCLIMAAGATLQGIGGMINNFVCAKGYGSYSRNASFIRGGINIVGYTFGIQNYGITGAAMTVLISGISFLIALMIYYKIVINKT